MRKQIFVTALLVINGLMLNAQWSGSNNTSGLIYRDGNVLIGGSTLAGTYGNTGVFQIQAPTETYLSFRSINSPSVSLDISCSPTFGAGIYSNQIPLSLWTNYAERLRINTDGNIGIGTTTPGAKLVVNGKARVLSNLSVGADEDGADFFNLYIKATNAGIGFNNSNQPVDQRIWSAFTIGNQFKIITESDNYMSAKEALVIYRSGVNINSVAFPNGNVLIGKNSQTNTSYILDVNGNVRANKLVVNTTGADFVFDSSYKLMTLKNLDSFIQRNHHLPDIKLASEMQQNGVDLGENQIKLLQKVEELTLYTIDQNKKLEQQQSLLQQQQSVIESLQAQLNELKKKIK